MSARTATRSAGSPLGRTLDLLVVAAPDRLGLGLAFAGGAVPFGRVAFRRESQR